MEPLFFYLKGPIYEVAKRIYGVLGASESFKEGQSSHVVGGVYYSWLVFGVSVKLEMNGYDYEDDYNYMIAIKRDMSSDTELDDEIIKNITSIIRQILFKNLKFPIAQEVSNGVLKVFTDLN